MEPKIKMTIYFLVPSRKKKIDKNTLTSNEKTNKGKKETKKEKERKPS